MSTELVQATEQVKKAQSSMKDQQYLVQTLVDTSNQVSIYTNDVSNRIKSVRSLSNETEELAVNGEDRMNQLVEQMNRIDERTNETQRRMIVLNELSKEIMNITSVLQDIASQTKLLSLNAALEAARAGEHGLGFNVVATEVRKLAESSNTSSKNVESIVKKISSEIDMLVQSAKNGAEESKKGTADLEETKRTFQSIHENINGLKENHEVIHAKMKNLNEISEKINSLSKPIASNRILISEGLEAAGRLQLQMKVVE